MKIFSKFLKSGYDTPPTSFHRCRRGSENEKHPFPHVKILSFGGRRRSESGWNGGAGLVLLIQDSCGGWRVGGGGRRAVASRPSLRGEWGGVSVRCPWPDSSWMSGRVVCRSVDRGTAAPCAGGQTRSLRLWCGGGMRCRPAGRWRVRGGVVVWCRAGCGSSAPGESLAVRCNAVSTDVPPRAMPSAWDEHETLVECESVGWRWSAYGGIGLESLRSSAKVPSRWGRWSAYGGIGLDALGCLVAWGERRWATGPVASRMSGRVVCSYRWIGGQQPLVPRE